MERRSARDSTATRFIHLYDEIENYADIGVARLPSSEGDDGCVDGRERYDDEIHPLTNINQLQLLDTRLEPTPPCNVNKNPSTPPKLKRQSVKHKIEECTPSTVRRRPKQMKPRAIIRPDHFACIPDELVLQIFQWLPRYNLKQCALTCRRWRRLAYDESLWQSLNLGAKNITPENVGLIINRGIVALRLAKADLAIQSAYQDVLDPFMECGSPCETKLQHLDLSMASVTSEGLVIILSNCTNLRNVSLESCQVNDTVCRCLGRNTELQQLNLALCAGLTAKGLKKMLKPCHNLDAVNLAWTHLDVEAIESVMTYLPCAVARLNLSGCRDTLTDDHVADLVTYHFDIEDLDLSDCGQLTEKALVAIAEGLPLLQCLSLARCYNISPQYYSIIGSMSSLTHLDLHGLFTSQGVQFLKLKYPSIQLNQRLFSTVARPTTGNHRTSIWGHKVFD